MKQKKIEDTPIHIMTAIKLLSNALIEFGGVETFNIVMSVLISNLIACEYTKEEAIKMIKASLDKFPSDDWNDCIEKNKDMKL